MWLVLLFSGLISLIITLFLALYWRVFNLIDEISGRKAKRQIAKLREYNNSTGEITSVSTGELELVMAGGGTLVSNTSESSKTTSSSEKSLREMIDDPYGSVSQKAYAPSKGTYASEVEQSPDDGETGILSESTMGIVILEEQSSL